MDPVIAHLTTIVGARGVLGPADLGARADGIFSSETMQGRALVRPANTAEVSAVMRWCHEQGLVVIPHGGLTGLTHATKSGPSDIIISTERMRAIEAIDPMQRTATVQAGVTLQALQEAVEAQGMIYPLDLGARGTATLGGTVATNAGGNRVLRYGMTRDMVLGLEAVLADGTVISSLYPLIKNNTGYDLKHLFIGSEGTLGVITRLVLRLREKPLASHTAMVAVETFDQVAGLLRHMDRALGGALSSFEVMWRSYYTLVTTPPAKGRAPLPNGHSFYVLLESQGSAPERDAENFQEALGAAMEQGLLVDAMIAQSESETRALWAIRDDVVQLRRDGDPVGFDISLPVSRMDDYVREVERRLEALPIKSLLYVFGHLGDGNLHVVVAVPGGFTPDLKHEIETAVYAPLQARGGSVSAEHGIGLDKKPWLPVSRTEPELAVMRHQARARSARAAQSRQDFGPARRLRSDCSRLKRSTVARKSGVIAREGARSSKRYQCKGNSSSVRNTGSPRFRGG